VRPRLRALEVAPFQREGRALLRVRDPLGVSPSARGPAGLVLSAGQWEFARRLDGTAIIEDAAAAARLDSSSARTALELLDAELLLENERAHFALDQALQVLRASQELPARGPGVDYEADPMALRIAIAGRVADDWDLPASTDLAGAFAPASGLRSRSALFARTYAALRHHERRFARLLWLGPAPAPLDAALIPLDRPVGTPLGRVEVDREALGLLPPAQGHDLLAHAASLALERHALFLRLILPRLPICAVLVPAESDVAPRPTPRLERALEALRSILDLPGRTLLVAACDLAELAGESDASQATPRGAAERAGMLVTGGPRARLRADDAAYVDALTRLDGEALWELGRGSENALRRACLPLVWLALGCMQGRTTEPDGAPVRGTLLGYQQAAERTGVVSSASVAFH
jgi:AmmeMemoRadiSam system protein B